jgi:hypothetical protein
MPKKTKIFLLIFGIVGLGFHPTLALYLQVIPTSAYLSALATHFAIFVGSFAVFYISWKYLPFKAKEARKEDAFRGMTALMGYACLFLGLPVAIVASLISFFITKTSSPENAFGPALIGGAVAGFLLAYPLGLSKK